MFPQVFGKYVLERELASGGMARVYLATLRGAVGFEKRLIVKQIRPELASDPAFVRRFVEEAKTTVELSHPNIVPVYELGVEQGVYYIAMEFCEGVTLSELLAETGPLSPEEGAYVGVEICRALDYAHRRAHIVHRDVTPRNVIINDEGGVRLIDFGIAAPAQGGTGSSTARAEIFGSPGHMPPEQLEGKPLGPASDVFAVAVLLIEAWTGSPPFRRETVEACENALHEPRRPLQASDERLASLSDLFTRATSLVPDERPESAELLARPLRQFLRNQDLGELERRLGLRVARARRGSQPRIPRAERASQPATGGPSTPAMAAGAVPELSTRTFAAREDLNVWTRKLPSIPPAPAGEASAEARPPRASKAKTLRIDAAADSQPVPVLADTPQKARKRPVWAAGALAVVLLALLGVTGARWVSDSNAHAVARLERGATATAARALAPGTEAPALVSPPASAPEASAERERADAATALASSEAGAPVSWKRAPTTLASSSAAPAPLLCSLSLSSEPKARVSIAGRVGDTPLALRDLAPGTYQVVFVAPALNEKLVGTVQLLPGDKKQVHADFTGAAPRMY
ncbi:MAG TPA: protein kinase [Polyangiaceae bacterium]|nr:protein kinase [Polyangiaceae bacterium]